VLEKCTTEICKAIENSFEIDESFVFTNVPRRRRAIVKYGMDHSELLAKSIATRFGVPYVKMLKSKAKEAQKTLSRDERLKNTDFRLISDISLKGTSVIIVDDIITTGASVSASASMIRSLSPKNIYAASLAIAYRDDA
jgi:predicted amidophosphoribosyltransferase